MTPDQLKEQIEAAMIKLCERLAKHEDDKDKTKIPLDKLLAETGWDRDQIDRTVCHQVGSRHRMAMLEAMRLDPSRDSVTFPMLGNTGSVALPLTVAAAAIQGQLSPQDHVAMLGIGSGINSVMLGVNWQQTKVAGNLNQIVASETSTALIG